MKEISEGGIDGMHSGLENSNGTKESSEGTTRRRATTASFKGFFFYGL